MAKKSKRLVSNLDFTNEIIKALKRVQRYSGHRAAEIFGDWLSLVDATLDAGPDSSETTDLFCHIRSRYAQAGRGSGAAHEYVDP